MSESEHFDFIVIGSGFGGSVSALRLLEKGYRVLMLEQGSEFSAEDFAKTNWQLKRWLWLPALGLRGILQLRFFKDVTVLAGAGVGGGSLGYACTLPMPPASFYRAESWAELADWQTELEPHYATARRMLGAEPVPRLFAADALLEKVAERRGQRERFQVPEVGIYFGQPGKTAEDPYFEGKGPSRTGCRFCGACMTGCRHGSKNTLDKNYLYLARKLGLDLRADTRVTLVQPLGKGYRVSALQGKSWFGRRRVEFKADRVVVSAGTLGSVDLLLKMKAKSVLPKLSPVLGERVRTNEESLIAVTMKGRDRNMSQGVAIGSLLQTDEHSHVEAVRYGEGSGFWRLLGLPHVAKDAPGVVKVLLTFLSVLRRPLRFLKAYTVSDWAKNTAVLLYMRSFPGSLRFVRRAGSLGTALDGSGRPRAYLPEASEIARDYAEVADGVEMSLFSETLLNVPTTAHILGGCCMGKDAEHGVINTRHEVYNYPGLYVIDGSAVSANPGVNPSLTITALAERAMSGIHSASPASEASAKNPAQPRSGLGQRKSSGSREVRR